MHCVVEAWGAGQGRARGLYALVTAGFTASYTLVDAVGARASGSASAYTCAMFILSGAGFVAVGFAKRGATALSVDGRVWRLGTAAGALSFLAYWAAIWAFTQAPVALVAALRETSVLMAMLIGVVFWLAAMGFGWIDRRHRERALPA